MNWLKLTCSDVDGAAAASDEAMGAWVRCLAVCAQTENGGIIRATDHRMLSRISRSSVESLRAAESFGLLGPAKNGWVVAHYPRKDERDLREKRKRGAGFAAMRADRSPTRSPTRSPSTDQIRSEKRRDPDPDLSSATRSAPPASGPRPRQGWPQKAKGHRAEPRTSKNILDNDVYEKLGARR